MEDKSYLHTENLSGQLKYAAPNEIINPLDLAMQIYPLLTDYFNGTFAKNTKGVLMKMGNGQVFQLIVTEVE